LVQAGTRRNMHRKLSAILDEPQLESWKGICWMSNRSGTYTRSLACGKHADMQEIHVMLDVVRLCFRISKPTLTITKAERQIPQNATTPTPSTVCLFLSLLPLIHTNTLPPFLISRALLRNFNYRLPNPQPLSDLSPPPYLLLSRGWRVDVWKSCVRRV
jgi:hypothetical protein